MKLVILGATGGVGRELVATASRRHDELVIVARDVGRLPDGWNHPVAELDLARPNPASLASTIAGADAVVSALGARGKTDHGILATAATHVLSAMRDTGVRRYVGISAAPVATTPSPARPTPPRHDPGDDVLTRRLLMPIVKRVFADVYADSARMEDVVRASDLEWSVLRPPRLTNANGSGHYRTAMDQNVRGGRSIGRADLARYMIDIISDTATFGHTIGIAY
jgi:putative NADH-flavin reductase